MIAKLTTLARTNQREFARFLKFCVVGTLGAFYGTGEDNEALTQSLQDSPSMYPLNALGLMVFTLIYTPCLATVAVIRKETGSWKLTLFSVLYSIALAWIVVFAILQVGKWLGFG